MKRINDKKLYGALYLCAGLICIFLLLFSKVNFIIVMEINSIIWLITTVFRYKESIYENLHKIIFWLIVIPGLFYILISPSAPIYGYDETTHYKAIVSLEGNFTGKINPADEITIGYYGQHSADVVSHDGQLSLEELQDKTYKEKSDIAYTGESLNWQNMKNLISYSPYLFGRWIGELLKLNYSSIYRFSKFINLSVYAVLISLAIKTTKSYKTILSCIGTLPLIVFEAASYQYDPFLIGNLLLGFSLFIRCYEERKIALKKIIAIVGFITLGLTVKPVYFPIMIPMLFMDPSFFENKKQQKLFHRLLLISMLLMIIYIFLPAITGDLGAGDVRGGTDVNATEQVYFILNNPVKYGSILIKYMIKEYLNPFLAFGYIVPMGSIGIITISIVPFFLLVCGTLFNGNVFFHNSKYQIVTWISWLISVSLVITSLYVSFTGVASENVSGVQLRYHLPVLVMIMTLFKGKVNDKKAGAIYAVLFALVMSLVFIMYMGNYFYAMN